LGGHPRLALVLAPGDYPDAGDQDDRRVRVAHRRRARPLARLVVRGVVGAVPFQPGGNLLLEPSDEEVDVSVVRVIEWFAGGERWSGPPKAVASPPFAPYLASMNRAAFSISSSVVW